jgi:hypothetical protein
MKNSIKSFFLLSALFVFIAASYLFGSSAQSFFNQTIYLLAPITAAVAGLMAIKIYGWRDPAGRDVLFIALGLVFWTLGDVLWYVFKLFLKIDPFPSVADMFYLIGYVLIFIGIYKALRLAEVSLENFKKIGRPAMAAISLLVAVLILIVSYFGIYLAYDPSAGALTNFFGIGYGVADLILIISSLLALMIITVYRGGKFASFWARFIIALCLFLLGDILFAFYGVEFENDLKPYIYIDLFYAGGYLLFAYAMFVKYYTIIAVKKNIEQNLTTAV